MSYVIANLIYGIPLLQDIDLPFPLEDNKCFPNYEDERTEILTTFMDKYDSPGLICNYSGNSDTKPGAFGVLVGSSDVNDLFFNFKIGIDQSTKNSFNKLWNTLPENIKVEIKKYGEPRLFVLWSTS